MSSTSAPTNYTTRTPTGERPRRATGDTLTAVITIGAVVIIVLLAALLAYQWSYSDRVYEGVTVFGTKIGGMSRTDATAALTEKFDAYLQQPVHLRYGDREWSTTLQEMGVSFDVQRTMESAFAFGRTGSPIERLQAQFKSHTSGPTAIKPRLSIDDARKSAYFATIARQIDQPVKDAALTVDQAGLKVAITASQPGQRLDVDKTTSVLEQALLNQSATSIDLVVEKKEPAVVKADLEPIQAQAQKALSAPLTLAFEDKTWTLSPKDMAPWLTFQQGKSDARVIPTLADRPLKEYLQGIAKKIDRPAVNARFSLDEGSKALTVIKPSVNGAKLDVEAAINVIKEQAFSDKRDIALPVTLVNPLVKAEDASSLVVTDLIEQDSTSYAGSIPERAHNVELAAERLNGIVVAPGQTFSFNDEMGPVTLASGFQIGYGITVSDGEMVTVPSEGGGICQVATTLFHPVFWAGYPIVERVGHLYWIPKYGQPPKGMQGLDATVDMALDKDGNVLYSVDFKWQNNTDHAVLIQSGTHDNKVFFKLWGVKPDWEVKVDGPIIEDVVKANTETVKQDDPTMPVGKTLWVEEARDGFKSTITRKVMKDGAVLHEQQIISRYRPSRNVILVGTKPTTPAAPTSAPASGQDQPTTPKPGA